MACYILVTLYFHTYEESHSRNDVVQVLPLVPSFWKPFPLIQIPIIWFLYTRRENTRTFQLSFPTSSSNIPILSINKISKTHHCPMKQKETEAKSKARENVLCILKCFKIHDLIQSLFLNLPVHLEVEQPHILDLQPLNMVTNYGILYVKILL